MSDLYAKREFTVIKPELVAAKLAAIQNCQYPEILNQISEQPRFVEMLWFLQSMSMRPGGLVRFVQEMLDIMPEKLGTRAMHEIGHFSDQSYSAEESLRVWDEIPEYYRNQLEPESYWIIELVIDEDEIERVDLRSLKDRHEWGPIERDTDAIRAVDLRSVKNRHEWSDELMLKVKALGYSRYMGLCREAASKDLPSYLASLCTEEGKGFKWSRETWYMADVSGAVFAMMDLQARKAVARLAMTKVALGVFDALDFALQERCTVRIEGDTRFGKTEALQAWTAMRPGLARLVSVPCSNCDTDLFKAIADALGIVYALSPNSRELKEKVEYVLKYGRLMLVLDEGHFLLPARFNDRTPAMRINWLRTQVIDKKIPVAIVSTPQRFNHGVRRFVKVTGDNIEQFLGRNLLKRILPTELDEGDLRAVARIHFPELDEDYLALIAAKAMQSESYLMAVEAISKRARFIAKRESHAEVTLADLETAISEILPAIINKPAATMKPPCKRSASATAEIGFSPRKVDDLKAPERGGQLVVASA